MKQIHFKPIELYPIKENGEQDVFLKVLVSDNCSDPHEVGFMDGCSCRGEDVGLPREDKLVFYIKRLYLEETFRGSGIGAAVLDMVYHTMEGMFGKKVDHMVLKPIPIERMESDEVTYIEGYSNNREIVERLHRFYKKAGFKNIESTNIWYR